MSYLFIYFDFAEFVYYKKLYWNESNDGEGLNSVVVCLSFVKLLRSWWACELNWLLDATVLDYGVVNWHKYSAVMIVCISCFDDDLVVLVG